MADNQTTAIKPKYKVLINQEWCKGCGICIEYCPKKILVAEGLDQKAKSTEEEKCIGCGMCEVHCPDFAIEIVSNND